MKKNNKHYIIRLTLTIFFYSTLVSAVAQESSSDSLLVKKFVDLYQQEGVAASMNYLYASNPWISDSDDAKGRLEEVVAEFGKLHGFELIKKARLNDRYSIFSYILLYERQPLRFSFVLYRPNETWRFQSFRYDNDLEEEMVNSTVVSWDF